MHRLKSTPISSLLYARKRRVQSDMRVHVGLKCRQPAATTRGTCRSDSLHPWLHRHQTTDTLMSMEMFILSVICTVQFERIHKFDYTCNHNYSKRHKNDHISVPFCYVLQEGAFTDTHTVINTQ